MYYAQSFHDNDIDVNFVDVIIVWLNRILVDNDVI